MLPNEILSHIISYISDLKTIVSTSCVSRWFREASRLFVEEITGNDHNTDFILSCPNLRKIKDHILIESFLDIVDVTKLPKLKETSFKVDVEDLVVSDSHDENYKRAIMLIEHFIWGYKFGRYYQNGLIKHNDRNFSDSYFKFKFVQSLPIFSISFGKNILKIYGDEVAPEYLYYENHQGLISMIYKQITIKHLVTNLTLPIEPEYCENLETLELFDIILTEDISKTIFYLSQKKLQKIKINFPQVQNGQWSIRMADLHFRMLSDNRKIVKPLELYLPITGPELSKYLLKFPNAKVIGFFGGDFCDKEGIKIINELTAGKAIIYCTNDDLVKYYSIVFKDSKNVIIEKLAYK